MVRGAVRVPAVRQREAEEEPRGSESAGVQKTGSGTLGNFAVNGGA